MKGAKFWSIIGNPYMLVRRTWVNVSANEKKVAFIAKGVEAMKKQQPARGKKRAAVDEEQEVKAKETAEENQPTQAKKRVARDEKE